MKNGRTFATLGRLVLVCTVLAAVAGAQSTAPSSPPEKADPWKPVRLLVGTWQGDATGEPGTGKSEREYRFTLKDRYIQIASKSTYPPQDENPRGEVHEDVGFISYDKIAQRLVLRQFHIEGFVNHYVLDSISADGRTVVLVTAAIENLPAGWRGRETYRIVSDDEFVEIFDLAEPGKEFATYSQTRFRRKR
jgi:hypothetical protein